MRDASRGEEVPTGFGPTPWAEGFSLVALLAFFLRRRRILVGVPVAVVAIAVTALLIIGRKYSADSSFKPQVAETGQTRWAGLAAQLGLSLPGMTIGDPVKFYSEVATSREVLAGVINTVYHIRTGRAPADTATGNLIQLLRVSGPTAEDRMRIALRRLRAGVIVTNNREAGLVYVRTITKWPELSVQINRRILDLLNELNQRRRQSQAAAEREFVEGRLADAKRALEDAETQQKLFLQHNRRYTDSPELQLEFARLQRRVELQNQVYQTLAQSYEQARIEEVRNTPLLVIIDRPEGSARRYGSRLRDAIMWLFIGGVIAVLIALGADYVDFQGLRSGAELASLRAEAGSALRALAPRRRGARAQGP